MTDASSPPPVSASGRFGDALLQKAHIGVLFLLLLTGLAIFRDYGLSWDEPEMQKLGEINWDYFTGADRTRLVASDRPGDDYHYTDNAYHGPAFELLNQAVLRSLGLRTPRVIHFCKHLLNFLLFWGALWSFHALCRRRLGDAAALAALLMLVLSPRIFAEAFYNNRDVVFLSAFMLSLASCERALRLRTPGALAWHALACAFATGIRVIGAAIPLLTALALLFTLSSPAPPRRRRMLRAAGFLLLWFALTTLLWPTLWRNPPLHFWRALLNNAHYPWPPPVRYFGEYPRADQLPWHYIPVWVGLTTPAAYLILAAAGLFSALRDAAGRYFRRDPRLWLDGLMLGCMLGPWLAAVTLHSVLYDGWRHLYFCYPPLLYFSALGLQSLWRALAAGVGAARTVGRLLLAGALGLSLAATASLMIRLHPLQNVYFAFPYCTIMPEMRAAFEMDYWGLSYREGLEWLSERPGGVIRVYSSNPPGRDNIQMLRKDQAARLQIVTRPSEADYFITIYRLHSDHYPGWEMVYRRSVLGATVMGVYRRADRADSGARVE